MGALNIPVERMTLHQYVIDFEPLMRIKPKPKRPIIRKAKKSST